MMMTRGKELLKLLKRLIKQEHLYSTEQLIEMKSQIRVLENEQRKIMVAVERLLQS
jgi:hypothetical protein